MMYHFTPTRIDIIQRTGSNKYRGGCRGTGTLIHDWWQCKMVHPLWNRVVVPQKVNYYMTQ
jgi:hypothetical protein